LRKYKELKKDQNHDLFNQVINLYELRKIVMTGGLLTWSNKKKNPTLKKLCSILVSINWEIFPLAMVHKIHRNNYHHNPLILKLNSDHLNLLKSLDMSCFGKMKRIFLKELRNHGCN
jgi:hypothetical protein